MNEKTKKPLKDVISSFEPTTRGRYTIKLSVIGAPVSHRNKAIAPGCVASVCLVIQDEKTDKTLVRFFSHEDGAIKFIDDIVEGRISEDVFEKIDI